MADLAIIASLADLRTAAHLAVCIQSLTLCVALWIALRVGRSR